LNRERERGRGRQQSKFYLTSAYVPQNLENAILDQQQRTTQEHRGVEVKRQRLVEINQIILIVRAAE